MRVTVWTKNPRMLYRIYESGADGVARVDRLPDGIALYRRGEPSQETLIAEFGPNMCWAIEVRE